MKIRKVVDALEQFAPLPLQEDYDNAGLQIGLTEAEVSGVLLCLDVTEAVVDEAIACGCNLIVSHHPLIFHKLSQLTGGSYVERCVIHAVRHGVAIIAMHTNMDNAYGGVNFKMAEKMHLRNVEFLGPRKVYADSLHSKDVSYASGCIGELSDPLPADEFVSMLKRTFNVVCVQTNELLRRPISRIALCGGAGSFLLTDAIRAKADAFVTGEMHYHEYFGHEQEIQIAVIGHHQSEQFTNEIFKEIIERECPGIRCYMANTNTNPIYYM